MNSVHTARKSAPPARVDGRVAADRVGRIEERMAPLRAALARHAVSGLLGYVGDVPAPRLADDAGAMEEYFLCQFALAPRVLEAKAAECRWAVVNRHAGDPVADLPEGFSVVENLGGGVLLIRKESR